MRVSAVEMFHDSALYKSTTDTDSDINCMNCMLLNVCRCGLESCPISNKQYRSLDFALNGCFRKIFRTKSAKVVQSCMQMFSCFPVQNVDINFLLIMLHRIIV